MISRNKSNDDQSMDFEEDYSDYYTDIEKNDDEEMNTKSGKSKEMESILYQRTNAYCVHTQSDLIKYFKSCVEELKNNFGLPESVCYKILNKTGWVKKRALAAASTDADASLYDEMSIEPQTNLKGHYFDCPICWSQFKSSEGATLSCLHYFCIPCFKEHLENSISCGDNSFFLTCPWEGCKELVTEEYFKKYLSTALFEKYRSFKMKKIVDSSKYFIWCPSSKCDNVIELNKLADSDKAVVNIRCNCGHSFCFQCRETAHRPITCEMHKDWLSLTGGKKEYLNELWIKQNTKKCPKCHYDIEKNQGCMHMICRSCNHHFCWICLGDWKTHGEKTGGFYNCNIYKESKDPKKDDSIKELEKFNFYRDRYEANLKSIELAEKKRVEVLKSYKNLEGKVKELKDFEFLNDALDLVVESRRAITMTYALGYYMKMSTNKKEIFEMNQAHLWEHLDALDELTDLCKDFAAIWLTLVDDNDSIFTLETKFKRYRIDVVSKTSFLTTACNKILLHIENNATINEDEKAITAEKSTRKPGKKPTGEKEIWYCAYCTYANENSSKTCEMCTNSKKVLTDLSLLM